MKNYKISIILFICNILSVWVSAQTSELDSLTQLLEQHTTEDSTRVNLLNSVAQILYRRDTKMALNYASEANEISTQINFLKGKASSFNLIGLCQDSYDKMLVYHEKALKIFQQINDKKGMNRCYMNIGIAYRRQGNYPRALENYQKALSISEEIGDKYMLSGCYNSMGIIHRYKSDYSKAITYYQKSLAISEEIEDVPGISNGLNNIGVIHEIQNNYDTALVYYKRALEIHLKEGYVVNQLRIAQSYYNIGLAYVRKEEYTKAYEYLQKSLEISTEIKNNFLIAYGYLGLADIAMAQGNLSEAYTLSKKAYNLAKDIGSIEQMKDISEVLSKSASALGNYKEAYEYHVLHKEMNDSLFNENNIEEIVELEYEYKFEKEQREAELLQQKKDAVRTEREQKQKIVLYAVAASLILMSLLVIIVTRSLVQKRKTNEILELQKEQLIELNNTKDKFFSIISHDLKNPFNAILGFSGLLLTGHKTLDDDEREEMIRYVSTSAESAFKLLDNLLTWAQSQSGNIEFFPEDIDLSRIVAETVENVQGQATEKGIHVISEVSESMEMFGDKNMLLMVLRNLVSNALKFTHNGGEVRINAKRREGDVLVSVSDTGVGISEATLSNLFKVSQNASTVGTNNEKGTGLGLILCKEFIEQHGGSIWAESEVEKGSTFYFTIPTK